MTKYLEYITKKEEVSEELRRAGKISKITDIEVCRQAGRADGSVVNLKNKTNQTSHVTSDLFKALEAIYDERMGEV